MSEIGSEKRPRSVGQVIALLLLGAAAGFLSGMFGVGGGVIIVPGLMAVAGFSQRLASGTSLAAIVPLASVGVVSYAMHGSVSWVGALLLAVGAVGGAQLGTWLLSKLNVRVLQIIFGLFMLSVVVMLFFVVPSRDATLQLTVPIGFGLIAVGFATGTLSGLLGVGGGVIVVPALMMLFGVSDLVAKGTSLLVMIPTAIAGTVSNVRRDNVDLPTAAIVAAPACATTYLGSLVAKASEPGLANILFAAFLSLIAIQLLWKALRAPSSK